MMDFVGPPDSFEIRVFCISKKFESLVDENIMNHKIGKSIQGDTQADPKQKIKILSHTQEQSGNPGESKNQEEEIIVLKESTGFLFMMILV